MKTKHILLFGSLIPASILIISIMIELLVPGNFYACKAIGILLIYMFVFWLPVTIWYMHHDNNHYHYVKLPPFM